MRTLSRIRLFRLTIPLLALIFCIVGVIIIVRAVFAGGATHYEETCAFLVDDEVITTTNMSAVETPGGTMVLKCQFDPATLPLIEHTYTESDRVCKGLIGDTYFSRLIFHKDGSLFIICHWNGSPRVFPDPSVTPPAGYRPPTDLPGHNDGSVPPGQTSASEPEAGTTSSTSMDAGAADVGDTNPTGDTENTPVGEDEPVQGAGGSLDPAPPPQGDNNNGKPPDHANTDNQDGVDKDKNNNGNGNGDSDQP